jgi:hypothetical protein
MNRLTFDQSYELRCWLETRRAEAAGAKAAELAAQAGEVLGFKVTPGNVDGARQAMGIPVKITDMDALARRLVLLEGRLDQVAGRVDVILKAIEGLPLPDPAVRQPPAEAGEG